MSGPGLSLDSPLIYSGQIDDEAETVASEAQDSVTSGVPSFVMPPPRSFSKERTYTTPPRTRISSGNLTTSSISSKSPLLKSKTLRRNLTREQVGRDPLVYYEVMKVIGVGSMGSVSRVQKRASVIGGSARPAFRRILNPQKNVCFEMPIIGGFFQNCWKQVSSMHESESCDSLSTGRESLEKESSRSALDSNNGQFTSSSNNSGKNTYAMKSIHLSRVTNPSFVEELKNEIEILQTLDHPHIVRLMETFEHRNQIFMIMECCSGGDLYTRDPYTEPEAARIISCILSAISYMHSRNVSHRDLKYENILFMSESPRAEIKLIDFGLSAKFGSEELTEGVGTIYTMAPEVLKGKYSKSADLWSAGVIAYMLLSSQMPFYGKKRKHIVESIMSGNVQFKGRRWKRCSEQSKHFCQDLLVVDPEDRATADEALSASWLNRRLSATVRNPHAEEVESAHHSMVQYSTYSKLKKVALMVVAHRSSSEEIGILRKVFTKYDTTRSGTLSYDNFVKAIEDVGQYSEEAVRRMFDAVDLDGSGQIRYTEFLAATIEAHGAISEERLAEAFDRIDSDDSGFISAENLKEMLGAEFPEGEIDEIIREADLTKDGKISYAEFLALWENQNEVKREFLMNDIAGMGNVTSSSDLSTLQSTEFGTPDEESQPRDRLDSRASFLERKHLSERKVEVTVKGKQRTVNFETQVEEISVPEF